MRGATIGSCESATECGRVPLQRVSRRLVTRLWTDCAQATQFDGYTASAQETKVAM